MFAFYQLHVPVGQPFEFKEINISDVDRHRVTILVCIPTCFEGKEHTGNNYRYGSGLCSHFV